MPDGSTLHNYVHGRFVEVLGNPDDSLGRDDHWALQIGPDKPAINVLLNGSAEVPAVWVFDPHSKFDDVMRSAIQYKVHVEDVLVDIQQRLARAKDLVDHVHRVRFEHVKRDPELPE
jgi:hypothetical protein